MGARIERDDVVAMRLHTRILLENPLNGAAAAVAGHLRIYKEKEQREMVRRWTRACKRYDTNADVEFVLVFCC